MDEDCRRVPKFLTARCVMLANITGREGPSPLLAFGSTENQVVRTCWRIVQVRRHLRFCFEMAEGLLTKPASFFTFSVYRNAVYFS